MMVPRDAPVASVVPSGDHATLVTAVLVALDHTCVQESVRHKYMPVAVPIAKVSPFGEKAILRPTPPPNLIHAPVGTVGLRQGVEAGAFSVGTKPTEGPLGAATTIDETGVGVHAGSTPTVGIGSCLIAVVQPKRKQMTANDAPILHEFDFLICLQSR
jgi:hypothetical protein